jgi:hypothetical protein
MKTISRRFVALAALVVTLAGAPEVAHAQLSKIFVASFGNDANDGSRGTPKRNFQAAHDAVAAGGQIVALDTAGYGALNIIKSLAVTVPPGVNGFVTVTGGADGITISAAGNDVVVLRGLIVEGGGSGLGGSGILAKVVGNLTVEDCTVRNIGEGVNVVSSAALSLYIHNCDVRGCVNGLDVQTNANIAIIGVVTGCRLEQNLNSGVMALINPAFPNSSVDLTLTECVSSGNGLGITAQGGSALVRVNNSTITGNSTGFATFTGGQVLSRVSNTLERNTTVNAFTSFYSAK